MNTTATETKARIFLTDYASYNNGSQFEFGHWVDLSDFSDADELREYITRHFAECDEKSPLDSPREEIMITDYEGFPESLYSECMDFDKVYKYLEIAEEIEGNLIGLWNKYQAENGYDGEIYENDEEFFEMFYKDKPMDAVRAAMFGDYSYAHDYVRFNGYANLESFDNAKDHVDTEELINWLIENR